MAGLLGTNWDDPQTQGILGAALSMLAASGPRPQRTSVGQIIGEGGLAGMNRYGQARLLQQRDEELERRNRLVDMQINSAKEKLARGVDSNAPSDIQSALEYQQRWNSVHPDKPITFPQAYSITKRDLTYGGIPHEMSAEGSLTTRIAPESIYEYKKRGAQAEAEGGGLGKLLTSMRETTGPDNRPQYSLDYDIWSRLRSGSGLGSGAPTQQPKSYSEELSGLPPAMRSAMEGVRVPAGPTASAPRPPTKDREQVLPVIIKQVGESATAARGAVESIGNLNRIRDTLARDVNVGPGALFRQFGGRVVVGAGMAGKDEAEKLANTRVLMQQLAQEDLTASRLLEGQGQVSNFEREAIAKAAYGGIETMTKKEILDLTSGLEKTRRAKIRAHGELVSKMPKDMPDMAPDFFSVAEPPEYSPQEGAQPAPSTVAPRSGRRIHNPVQWGQ